MDRRRALAGVALLGLACRAAGQAPRPARRVGLLLFGQREPWASRFIDELAALGHRDGVDVAVETRFAEGQIDRVPALVDELVRMPVDVLVANATPTIDAAASATRTIPIVMATAGDALGTGHVASLARPGGNLTGMSLALIELAGKTVATLHEALPVCERVGCLVHRDDPLHVRFLAEAGATARRLRLAFVPAAIDDVREVEAVFARFARDRVHGAIVQPILVLNDAQRDRIVRLQLAHRVPAIAGLRRFAVAGGFMAYASEFPDVQRRAARYVDRLLRGARPGELPVEQPSRFDLVVHAATARALGIAVRPSLLARAEIV